MAFNHPYRPDEQPPLVSVCMLAYNVEPFLTEAIEGVLRQRTTFPVELIIGEDHSTDGTRGVAEAWAARYPDRIRLLPSDRNYGIAGNAARVLKTCRGRYVAICDGDDVWADPDKLQDQVTFLERNKDYGVAYTDVAVISARGERLGEEHHADVRARYRSGCVFFDLLRSNFINNSTAVFRRSFLEGYAIDTDRDYYTHDHLLWLHISVRAKVHFIDRPTTLYRKHFSGVTATDEKLHNNRRKYQERLYELLRDCDRHYRCPINRHEQRILVRKLLSVIYRKGARWSEKVGAARLLFKYFPALLNRGRMVDVPSGKRAHADKSDIASPTQV